MLPHLFEKFYLCLAEHVNRLYGIANKEAAATITRVPVAKQHFDQLVLAPRCGLELIDAQVTNTIAECQHAFRRMLLFEHGMRGDSELNEVEYLLLGEQYS